MILDGFDEYGFFVSPISVIVKVGGMLVADKQEQEDFIKSQVSDSLRGAKDTDQVIKNKIVYAPPVYLRIIRIFVASLIGSLAIGMFTWLYVTAYERANYVDIEQYIAQQYEGVKNPVELPPLEERTDTIFPGASSLSEAGLDDLENLTQIFTVQFSASEVTEMRRDGAVLYFKIGRSEYSVELGSPDSYPAVDALIKSGDFNFSRYFEEETTNNKDSETNG
jgi:hypothetical protein